MTAAAFHEEWFCTESCDAIADLVAEVANIDGRIIEIGAWEGRSTCAIANAAYPRVVDSCDTWDGTGHAMSLAIAAERDVYAQWKANVDERTSGNVTSHRADWREWLPTVTDPVAFCFIDAGHSYRDVFDNLCAIVPLLTPGAVVCGDDVHHGPVQDAVFNVLGTQDVDVVASMWVWRMPDNPADCDVVRLRAKDIRLAPTVNEWQVHLDRTKRLWMSYVQSVSEAGHAASPGTVAYLYNLCDIVQPKRILDLGSGLSSAAFRKWATDRGVDCDIVSVDTDSEWLEKTRKFLVDNELSSDGLHLWPVEVESELFDLVFHDMAGGELRERVAPLAAAAVKRGGCIVFDDAQHAGHLDAFEKAAALNDIDLYSLAFWTFDAIGRYALVGFRDVNLSPLTALHAANCATPSDINEHLPTLAAMASRANHVVELGARSGLSTAAWLHGLRATRGRLTSVDLDAAPDIGEHDNWTHIRGDDTDDNILARVDECDILFIDTSHHYEHTLWELRNWSAKVRAGGLIVCHDTELWRPWDPPCPETDPDFPVRSAIEVFTQERQLNWVNIPGCWGLAIIEVT